MKKIILLTAVLFATPLFAQNFDVKYPSAQLKAVKDTLNTAPAAPVCVGGVCVLPSGSKAAPALFKTEPLEDTVKLYYFTFEKCPWCRVFEKAFFDDFYANYQKTYNGKLEVIKVDIFEGCNQEVYDNALKFYNNGKPSGVPAVIVGSSFMVGTDQVKENLPGAIEKAFANHEQTKVSLDAECEAAPPLILAVKEGNFSKVQAEYKGPQSLTETDSDGVTALMWALKSGNHKIAEFLISVTPEEDINQADKYGETALYYTAQGNGDNTDLAKALIAKGAKLEFGNSTLLSGATTYAGNKEIFDLAMKSASPEEIKKLSVPNGKQWNILMSAAVTNDFYKANALIKAGAVTYESQRETINESTWIDQQIKALLFSVMQPDPAAK